MITNPRYPDHRRTAALIYNEVIIDDCYRLAELKRLGVNPGTIFDIGANIGFVAIQARVLFPSARVICLEPCLETRLTLIQNVEHLEIETWGLALGSAPRLFLHRDPHSDGSNRFSPNPAGEATAATTLAELVRLHARGSYVIKLDCEGGEASILHSRESQAALAGAAHWAMEYHTNLVGLAADAFLAKLRSIDPRAVGCPAIDDRWLFWSNHS